MWYLQKVQGPEVTAVYGGVRLITQAVLIGSVSIVFVVQTYVTKTWEALGRDQADRQLLLAFKATALLMLLGCVILATGAPVIMRLFPRSYAYGAGIFPLALLFFLIGGQLAFLAIQFILIEKTRYLFGLWALGLAGNVIFATWLVRPELEPPAALNAAAWAGVLGASAAMAASLVFIRWARRPIDVGSVLVIAAAYALALPGLGLAAIIAALLLLAGTTNVIFSPAEKQRIRDYMVALGTRVRAPWQ
jgi:O-antigen/teichoic acid export membrane protein